MQVVAVAQFVFPPPPVSPFQFAPRIARAIVPLSLPMLFAPPPCSLALPAIAACVIGSFVLNPCEKQNAPITGATRKTKSMSKQANKPATETSNAPVHTIRVNGIRASIWKNETDKGPRYNTTFERSYRDGEEWKNSDSYGREDLLVLSYVAKEAFRWIVSQPTK